MKPDSTSRFVQYPLWAALALAGALLAGCGGGESGAPSGSGNGNGTGGGGAVPPTPLMDCAAATTTVTPRYTTDLNCTFDIPAIGNGQTWTAHAPTTPTTYAGSVTASCSNKVLRYSAGSCLRPSTLLTTMPPNLYPAGSAENRTFAEINRVRLAGGFGGIAISPAATQAAVNHVNYMLPDLQARFYHEEVPGLSGFTGLGAGDRCKYAAVGTSEANIIGCGEVMALGSTPLDVYDVMGQYSVSPGHLQIVLHYGSNLIGMKMVATSSGGTVGSFELAGLDGSYALPAEDSPYGIVGIYPFDGMANVGVGVAAYDGQMNAISILIEFSHERFDGTNPTVTSFTLRKEGATVDTPSLIHESGTAHQGEPTLPGWAMLFPTVILEKNTKYNVSFVGSYGGVPAAKNWSFTTGESVYTIMAGGKSLFTQ